MLEKVVSVDLIEVVENCCVQVRTKTAIKEDGVEISSKFHRHVVSPIDDLITKKIQKFKQFVPLFIHQKLLPLIKLNWIVLPLNNKL